MALNFCSFSSGSSGNSYLIFTQSTTLLVDVGVTGKTIQEGLNYCGRQLTDLDAVFLTHEHHDHVRGLPVLINSLRKCDPDSPWETRIYGSPGTLAAAQDRFKGKVDLSSGSFVDPLTTLMIGDIEITTFRLSHDAAEPTGFRFDSRGKSLAIVTDTGIVNNSILRNVWDVDFLVLESNHEKSMLLMGKYPYDLKLRILGDYGHLSNDHAALALTEMIKIRNEENKKETLSVALAHLSNENNTRDMASLTLNNILFENDYIQGKDYSLRILDRDMVGEIITLD